MLVHVLRETVNKVIRERERTRPTELKNDLIKRMQDSANYGYDHIDYVFSDTDEIKEQVIYLLKAEGLRITYLDHGPVRFAW